MHLLQGRLEELSQRLGAPASLVLAALVAILGIAVINHPALLGWIFGIGMILTGVALAALALLPSGRHKHDQ